MEERKPESHWSRLLTFTLKGFWKLSFPQKFAKMGPINSRNRTQQSPVAGLTVGGGVLPESSFTDGAFPWLIDTLLTAHVALPASSVTWRKEDEEKRRGSVVVNQIWPEETPASIRSGAGRAACHRVSQMGDVEVRQPKATWGLRARESYDRSLTSFLRE